MSDSRPADCHPERPHHARGMCQPCYQRWQRENATAAEAARRREWTRRQHLKYGPNTGEAPTKRAACHPDRQHYAKGFCQPCYLRWWRATHPEAAQEHQRRDLEKNPRRWRDQRLRKTFGITLVEYGRLLREQGGVCAICRTVKPGGRWGTLAVDHDHATGKVRGLLCHTCNRLIGLARDDPERLRWAAAYLEGER